jgi:peptidoglycan hydrolase-like protein with peptidoglycan-binding domain
MQYIEHFTDADLKQPGASWQLIYQIKLDGRWTDFIRDTLSGTEPLSQVTEMIRDQYDTLQNPMYDQTYFGKQMRCKLERW